MKSASLIKKTGWGVVMRSVAPFFLCATFFSHPGLLAQSSLTVDDSVFLAEVVVTAQFMPIDVRETVNSVRVIDRKEIQQRAATNLIELLRTEPNIRISQDPILGSALTINGLPSENVKILVDGVPVIGRLDGAIDAAQLPLGAVQRVEIIEGAQSLIYGSAASAGVVNLLTKSSQLHNPEGEVTGLYEGYGHQSLDARVGVQVGHFGLSLSGGLLHFEAEEDTLSRDQLWNPKDQKNARLGLTFSPHENLTFRASGSVFSEDVMNLGEKRRPQFKPYAFDDFYQTDRQDVTLHGEGWLSEDLYWQTTAAYNQFDRVKNAWRHEFEDGSQSLIEGAQDTSAAEGVLLRTAFASNSADRKWDFLLGGDFYRETLADVRIVDSLEDQSGFAAIDEFGAFGSLKFKPSQKLILQGGARYTQNSLFGSAVTPSIWLAWRPGPWDVKLSYAHGFRSPGLKELYFAFIDASHFIIGNQELQPETSHNLRAELGRRKVLGRGWEASGTLSGFYNSIRDRIILAEYDELQFTYQNLAEWRTAGSGLSLQFEKQERIRVRSAILVTGYFNTLSEEGNGISEEVPQLSFSPDWTTDVTIDLFKGKAGVSAWHKMTGRTPYFYVDGEEVVRGERDAWHMINASAHAKAWKDHLRLTAGVKNILDVRNVKSISSGGAMHGSSESSQPVHWGRTFFVQARLYLYARG